MASPRLTPTSYIVLMVTSELGEATPYALKQAVEGGLANLWSLQHAQLYTETEKLAKAGLLTEEREESGRRRKTYRITKEGKRELDEWIATPTAKYTELRDLGLLKLAMGADPATLAAVQLEIHEAKLREYEELRDAAGDADLPTDGPGGMLALEAGIGHEREYVRFWSKLLKNERRRS
jgi:DNA-binding PadR family transcriptional regulator